MRLSDKRKLFVGLKLDSEMRRTLEAGPTPGRPIFKPGDPAYLDVVGNGETTYIGRVLDPGFSIEHFDDLERNIRSIVRLRFPEHRPAGSLYLFALDDEAAEGRDPSLAFG
jgi:hypothetical protein